MEKLKKLSDEDAEEKLKRLKFQRSEPLSQPRELMRSKNGDQAKRYSNFYFFQDSMI